MSTEIRTRQIQDGNVTLAKIASASANSKLLGSGASGSGAAYSEITLGSGLTMTGTTLSAYGGGGSAAWGDITGTLSNQTDLQSALDAKQDQDNLLDSIAGLGGNGVIRRVNANTAESVSDAEVVEDAINGATAKTSLVDADLFGIIDSAASNVLKKITWANIKSTLKTYFDGFYLLSGNNTVTQSTTTRTLALTDAFKYIRCTNASATTVTVPTNASVAFPIGTQIDVFQVGAGQVSFVAAGGVTINKAEGLKIAARYKAATLKKVGTNEWDLLGAIAA